MLPGRNYYNRSDVTVADLPEFLLNVTKTEQMRNHEGHEEHEGFELSDIFPQMLPRIRF